MSSNGLMVNYAHPSVLYSGLTTAPLPFCGPNTSHLPCVKLRGGPFDFWGGGGGGGVEENVPEQFIYFCRGRHFFFILTGVKNKLFLFAPTKDEHIFFSTYFCEPTGPAMSFDDNMSNWFVQRAVAEW